MSALKRLPKPLQGLLIAITTWALLFLTGLGVTWLHYQTTPDFDSYVQDHPVSELTLQGMLQQGTLVSEGPSWRVGEVDPFELGDGDSAHERHRLVHEVDVIHGEENLLGLTVEVALASRKESWDRDGVAVRANLKTRPGMRAVVKILLRDRAHLVGPGSAGRGACVVDVMLLSGEGEPRVEIIDLGEEPLAHFQGQDVFSVGRLLPVVIGLLHPLGSPPDEGLVYRTRSSFELSWKRLGTGWMGASRGQTSIGVNTDEYSYQIDVATTSHGSSGGSSSSTTSQSLTYGWGQTTW